MGENWKNADNIILIAVLENRRRVCQIGLWKPPSDQLPVFAAIVQDKHGCTWTLGALNFHLDLFLSESPPRLQSSTLNEI